MKHFRKYVDTSSVLSSIFIKSCGFCGVQGSGSTLPQTVTQANGMLPPEFSFVTAAQHSLP